jgi:hypothetical protein
MYLEFHKLDLQRTRPTYKPPCSLGPKLSAVSWPWWGPSWEHFPFSHIEGNTSWILVALATQEAEIRKISAPSQPGQIVPKTLSRKIPTQKRAGGVAQEVKRACLANVKSWVQIQVLPKKKKKNKSEKWIQYLLSTSLTMVRHWAKTFGRLIPFSPYLAVSQALVTLTETLED